MNLSPTAAIAPNAQKFLDNTPARAAKQTLDVDDFLKLLTTQMTNQDPMKPMEDTQFISQMASFTSLEQTRTFTKDLEAFTAQQSIATAAQYVGKNVTITPPNSSNIVGTVTGVNVVGGKPQIVINGLGYDASLITSIQAVPPTTTPPTAP